MTVLVQATPLTFVVVPDTQPADLSQAGNALHREHVLLVSLERIRVGLRLLQMEVPGVAVGTKQKDEDVSVCSCPRLVRGLHADSVVRDCNSRFGDK